MRRYLNILISILLVGMILGACKTSTPVATDQPATEPVAPAATTAAPEPTEPSVEEPEPVTLRIMDFSQELVEFYAQVETAFNEEYPWITVEWETMVQDDYNTTLPLMFQSGDSPDIFIYYAQRGTYFELAELLDYGWVQPLDPSALESDFYSRFPGTSGLMDPIFSHDGQVYAIPRDPQNGALGHGYMWYNPVLLEAAGVEVPTTWDELLDACRAIRSSGPYCLGLALNTPYQLTRTLIPLLSVNGYDPTFIDDETGLFSVSDPAFVETLDYLRTFYVEDLVLPGVNEKGFVRQAIADGTAAIYFDGGWMATIFPGSYGWNDFAVAAPPTPDADGYRGKVRNGPDEASYFISSQSEHPYEATLFLNWMTRPEGWFTVEYLTQTSYILPWADNERLSSSDRVRELVALSPTVRTMAPVPALKCPDLAQSTAMADANGLHPDWEYEAIAEYLLNGGDWSTTAATIEEAKNKVLTETLAAEQAEGLDVSLECYTAPGWDPTTDFDYSSYQP
jgi:ABC-type glycerol-3-phosphate transport system substrate-binding protein